jgi:hypothetical protein
MKQYLETPTFLGGHATNGELAIGLRSALDRSYGRIIRAASAEWDRRFAGKDPSDACVSVKITGPSTKKPRAISDARRRGALMPRVQSGVA